MQGPGDIQRDPSRTKLVTIKYVRAPAPRKAHGPLRDVYRQIKRDFGTVADPFLLHAPSPQLLIATWAAFRETLLVGIAPRSVKEVVAATVSRHNQCPYCVDAHSMMLDALSAHATARAIGDGRDDAIDEAYRDVLKWASSTRSPGAGVLRDPPFAAEEAPEIIGTAVLFHYINRMVSVLLDDSPLPGRSSEARARARRVAAIYFSRAARRPKAAGAAMRFVDGDDISAPPEWARSNRDVAVSFGRLTAVVEDRGSKAVAPEVRAWARRHVATWVGEEPGLTRRWVDRPLAELDEGARAAGRLVLLTALAPYQVDADVVKAFLAQHLGDESLVNTLAWSSLTAAMRIGSWLAPAEPISDAAKERPT